MRALLQTAAEAFGDGPPTDAQVAALRAGAALLARAGGEPAGAAFHSAIAEGVSELGGIGVRERFRRRGIAAALTGAAAAAAVAAGRSCASSRPATTAPSASTPAPASPGRAPRWCTCAGLRTFARAATASAMMGGTMTDVTPLQGELQTQIMAAIWRLDEGTVEQVRQALPPNHQGAYNTVQTVLNRLAERGLLTRRREGHVIVYAPSLSEAEYLSRSMEHTLRGASSEARQVAIAQLIGSLPRDEAAELGRLADEVAVERMR